MKKLLFIGGGKESDMCCDPTGPYPEDTVGKCPLCGCDVDKDGHSTEEMCHYSLLVCVKCGDRPCDLSC
jgi:hypothetical protein